MYQIKKLNSTFTRFLIVGFTTVCIDYITYFLLININFRVSIAKLLSFLAGTIFAYFLNKKVTFKVKGSSIQFFLFLCLYLFTMLINVVTNEIILEIIYNSQRKFEIAFFVATSASSCINFLGMKFLIFKKGLDDE